MRFAKSLSLAGMTVVATLAVGMLPAQAASCVVKAGIGTNSTVDGAKFQAWEAVLQATSWGEAWSPWMAAGGKVGTAPGYKVSGVRSKCNPGGIGYECKMQAKLCK
jgi:hypothetical protein